MDLVLSSLTVSELNQRVKVMLEQHYAVVAVSGEISNLSKPSSGHCYFTLKDAHAQIQCAFFKTHQRQAIPLQEGMQLIVIGKLSLFEARGNYQLIVQRIEEAGTGWLYRQMETLKRKLILEGLFDPQYKKPLPRLPHTIAVITSAKSAALRDILITLYKRYPLAEVMIYPCEVQGQTAPVQLTAALQRICLDNQADVILLARGGGSLEDLWAFNDETLVRAIFHATIPIVTGIGHETDFTLADFVADYRAATPTAAAAAITPDQRELSHVLQQTETRLVYHLTQQLMHARKQVFFLNAQLRDRSPKLFHQTQTLDYLEQQLRQAWRLILHKRRTTLQTLQHQQEKTQLRLLNMIKEMLTQHQQHLALQMQTLHSLSPLDTLNRGYAIATQAGQILLDSQTVQQHEPIELTLAKGSVRVAAMGFTRGGT